MLSFRLFFKSIRHAWRGLCDIARAEQSFRIQLFIAFVVFACIVTLPLDMWERILLVLLAVSVLVLEIVNSIFERLADAVHPRLHPMVREIKDMMAGAVLLAGITAAVVGTTIIFPHIFVLLCTSPLAKMLGSLCT